MFRLNDDLKVYLHRAPVDLRLSINGLATLVQQDLGMAPFAAMTHDLEQRWSDRSGHQR